MNPGAKNVFVYATVIAVAVILWPHLFSGQPSYALHSTTCEDKWGDPIPNCTPKCTKECGVPGKPDCKPECDKEGQSCQECNSCGMCSGGAIGSDCNSCTASAPPESLCHGDPPPPRQPQPPPPTRGDDDDDDNGNGGGGGGPCASEEEIERFLQDNPGDEHRIPSAFPCNGGGGGNGGGPPPPPPEYNLCTNDGACVRVDGDGSNQCSDPGNPDSLACPQPPPSCSSFTADPDRLVYPPGGSSTLSWGCRKAHNGCTLTPDIGSVPQSGSAETPHLTQTTDYVLQCEGRGGTSPEYHLPIGAVRVYQFTGGKLEEVQPQ